jgi:hypothetical protein
MKRTALFLILALAAAPASAAPDIVRMVCRDATAACDEFQGKVEKGAHQPGQAIGINCGWRYVEIDGKGGVSQWDVGPYVYDSIAHSDPLQAVVAPCNNCTLTGQAMNAVECAKCCTPPAGCHSPDWAGTAIVNYMASGEWSVSMKVKSRGRRPARDEEQNVAASGPRRYAVGGNVGIHGRSRWVCEAGDGLLKSRLKECLDGGIVYKAVTRGRAPGAKSPGSLIKGIPDLEIVDCRLDGLYAARRTNACGEVYAEGLGTVSGKTFVYKWIYKNMQCGRPVLSEKLGDVEISGKSFIPIAQVKDGAKKSGGTYVIGSDACFTHCYTGYKSAADAEPKDFSGGELDLSWDGAKKQYCNEQCFDPVSATRRTDRE